MFDIIFQIENGEPVTVSANQGDNLLEIARSSNVAIDAPCSGNGSCGKCRVKLLEGELDSPQTAHISKEDYDAGWRLSCASRVTGNATVLVPDIALAYQQRMKTADLSTGEEVAIFEALQAQIRDAGITFSNEFATVDVQLEEPTLDDTMPDNERLERELIKKTGAARCEISLPAMRNLATALRSSAFHIRVTGERRGDSFLVYAVSPAADQTPTCAIAVDIGTTTVSAVLTDLETGALLSKASAGNGQIRYGADVINRIVEQGKTGGRERLQKAILDETLLPLIRLLCKTAGAAPDHVVRMCIASNTTMNHLLLAVDADPVRREPYIPSFFHYDDLRAADLSLPIHPWARVHLAPNVGSYVGGDITAGTFASLIWNKEEFSLFIDLGTNGEIVFGNGEFLMCCACSAGPAFEGGDISCGMRATDGAIEAVSIDKETMEPALTVVGSQKPVGLCGSGIIDVIAELYRTSILGANGKFIREGRRIARDKHGMGRYILAFAPESETGREIAITEVDIESFIRAKGAIFSAIDTMLSSLEFDTDMIEHVYVAGGIGSGINMKNAVRIGMFPDVELEKFSYIGNSSLSGAYAMALSDDARRKVTEIAGSMTYMELSTHPGYMDRFVAACFLPHTDAGRFPTSIQE
nr:corrinoid activation/regeneration protein AcsV [uncultured Oscillibacter sp.]